MTTDNFFILDAPQFIPKYDTNMKYGYGKKTKMRENLKQLLYKTSQGYCMYCYTKIRLDRKDFGHLEHGIEKASDEGKILENCILNISIACPICNNKFKKKGEKERIEYIKATVEYSELCKKKCSAPKCYEMCDEYRELREKLYEHEQGHLILQPLSNKYPKNLHPKTNRELEVQYDLLRGEFIPNKKHHEELDEFQFVEDHINMFRLNDDEYRTNEIYRFCKDVINDSIGKLEFNKYNNSMVDVFICKLKGYNRQEIKKICELIYLRGLILGRNVD